MKHNLTTRKYERRARKLYALFSCLVLALTVMVVPAFAADDPLTVVNNLSEFIFSLIRAIGLILLGFGVLQLGLSLKSHDPSQRANGMLTIAERGRNHLYQGDPHPHYRLMRQKHMNTHGPFCGPWVRKEWLQHEVQPVREVM